MRHRHELFSLVRTGYQESDLLYGVLPEQDH
jgi:hypothetical protein